MKIINSKDIKESFYNYDRIDLDIDVKDIILDIKKNGDQAVRNYTKIFDHVDLDNIKISQNEVSKAYENINKETIDAFKFSAKNIQLFAEKQLEQFKDFEYEIQKGVITGQKIIPIEKIGVYVPGGRFPLPSSVFMGVIPAKVAGCSNIILCSPPSFDETINPAILVAADIAGVDAIYKIGGIQAIGAMAHGTESIQRVDKIVGPGNRYVTAAKKNVYGITGIDFIAGPTEVLIIADESANPEFVASDLLAQAEHDLDAQAVLITNSKKLANDVVDSLVKQIEELETKPTAELSIENNGLIIIEENPDDIIKIANRKAPEHLEIHVKDIEYYKQNLKNYGTLFIGNYAVEALGDYASGLNHTLPTNGSARYTGGLSVKDFIKIQTTLKIDENIKDKQVFTSSYEIAKIEGLEGHASSLKLRIDN